MFGGPVYEGRALQRYHAARVVIASFLYRGGDAYLVRRRIEVCYQHARLRRVPLAESARLHLAHVYHVPRGDFSFL